MGKNVKFARKKSEKHKKFANKSIKKNSKNPIGKKALKNLKLKQEQKKILLKSRNKDSIKNNVSLKGVKVSRIKNKLKRLEIFYRKKHEIKKIKSREKKEKDEEYKTTGKEKPKPITIEDKKEIDYNEYKFDDPEELLNEEKFDEFSTYFNEEKAPKILMTTSEKPPAEVFSFLKEIKTTFPNCFYYKRKFNYTLSEIAKYASNRK